jgi:hypothetical protein
MRIFKWCLKVANTWKGNVGHDTPQDLGPLHRLQGCGGECESTFVPLLSVLRGDYAWKRKCYQWKKNARVFLDVRLSAWDKKNKIDFFSHKVSNMILLSRNNTSASH